MRISLIQNAFKVPLRIAVCTLLPLAFTLAKAQSTPPADPRQSTIVALENAWNLAVKRKDVRVVDSLLAEELVFIEYDGTEMDKTRYVASIGSPAHNFEHIVSESMTVQSYGNNAVVVGLYIEKGMINGRPYVRRERFVDTWINRNAIWKCVASQSTLIVH